MSTLSLVRHGQASLSGDNYDQLSDRGIEQSRSLGAWWARRQRTIDAIYVGPKSRHAGTVEHLRQAAADGGHSLPEATLAEGFDEVDLRSFIQQSLQRVAPSCPNLPEQLASGHLDEDGKTALTHFRGMIDKLLERWALGEAFDGVQPFEDFSSRVRRALSAVMSEQGRGKHVVVVTSGGPIAVCVRLALRLEPRSAVDVLRQVINTSVTDFLYTETDLTLRTLNAFGHLTQAQMTRM